MPSNDVRLKNDALKPVEYDLAIRVKLSDWTYTATETIVLERQPEATGLEVVLHADPGIDIQSVDGATIVSRDTEKAHTITFALPNVDATRFTVVYANQISEELKGMYRCNYTTADGTPKRMASTHFEPLGARRFYICQDEPAARATFRLTVSLPPEDKDLTVLSNSPVESTSTEEDGSLRTVFAPIPRVPPYLTACCIGELEYIEEHVNGIQVRFYVTKGGNKLPKAKFGLEAAVFSLDLFEKFFQSPFPLPKMDLIAVPDFPIGGMENWGMITLIENALVDEATSSLVSLKNASDLVCHEVSHNWFGNLVGIDWWEGLWLKEGFAQWCGYFGTERLRPSWNSNTNLMAEIFHALNVDAFAATHPVEVPITDPADITQVFDSISYSKGMAVVKMLQQYLGEEAFSAGVAAYVKKFAYNNTVTTQLWETLEESSGKPIAALMSGFTKQDGHPVVSIEVAADKRSVSVSQKRYAVASEESDGTTWVIPLTFLSSTKESFATTLREKSATVTLPESFASAKWVLVNPGHTGFFRCHYDAASLSALLSNASELSENDLVALQNDQFALLQAGLAESKSIVALLGAMKSATTYNALADYLSNFSQFLGTVVDSSDEDKLAVKKQLIELGVGQLPAIANALVKKGTSSLTTDDKLMRRLVVGEAVLNQIRCGGDVSSSQLIAWCNEQGNVWLKGEPAPDVDAGVLGAVLSVAIQQAKDNAPFDALWKRFQQEKDDADVSRMYLTCLCKSPNKEHFDFILQEALAGNRDIRVQMGGIVFMGLSSNSTHAGALWPAFQANFADVDRHWGGGQFRIHRIVECVGSTLCGEAEAAAFETFFVGSPLPNAAMAIKRAAGGIRLRGKLHALYAQPVRSAL